MRFATSKPLLVLCNLNFFYHFSRFNIVLLILKYFKLILLMVVRIANGTNDDIREDEDKKKK